MVATRHKHRTWSRQTRRYTSPQFGELDARTEVTARRGFAETVIHYTSFGEMYSKTESVPQRYQWTGRERSVVSDDYYNRVIDVSRLVPALCRSRNDRLPAAS